MTDRPPATRGARIFGIVATAVFCGGCLVLMVLWFIWIAVRIYRGI